MSKKQTKKVAEVKSEKVVAPKKLKKGIVDGISEAKFVSLKVRAVIPVQQYGNIQPEIEVTAPTYEQARDFAMPKIEELWKTYAERPVNGNLPSFVGPITETVKTVNAPATAQKEATGAVATTPGKALPKEEAPAEVEVQLSEAGQKAKKMIELGVTVEALNLVEQKIKDSVKIPDAEKPVLYTMVLKKKKTI